MTIFRWKPKVAETMYPFGLTPYQLEQLGKLTEHRGFAIFTGLLTDIAELNGTSLLDSRDYGDLRERQGFIKALRHVIQLLPMIAQESQRLDNEQQRAKSTAGHYDDRSFYGSYWWDRVRSLGRKPED